MTCSPPSHLEHKNLICCPPPNDRRRCCVVRTRKKSILVLTTELLQPHAIALQLSDVTRNAIKKKFQKYLRKRTRAVNPQQHKRTSKKLRPPQRHNKNDIPCSSSTRPAHRYFDEKPNPPSFPAKDRKLNLRFLAGRGRKEGLVSVKTNTTLPLPQSSDAHSEHHSLARWCPVEGY